MHLISMSFEYCRYHTRKPRILIFWPSFSTRAASTVRAHYSIEFLRMIQDRGALQAIKLSSIEQDLQHVTVHREATIIAGRCDVIIQLSSRIFILIEVKVWAAEGDEQLARYSRWLENHRTSFPHRALVFLTPTGRASKTVEASAYIPLSFRPAIHGWLVGCLTQIQPLHVRSVLDEYVADLPGEEGASDGQSSG